ncbi:MAG: response regulator [Mariniblastus sp.]|nr:response regulator [Mariniblastus sp.]
MPTPFATDRHRIIIVTDNPTTRYDYNNLLRSNGQANQWPILELASWETGAAFCLDFAFTDREGLEKIKASQETGLPYSVVVIDLQSEPLENEIELAKQVWQVDSHMQVVLCTLADDTENILKEMGQNGQLDTDQQRVLGSCPGSSS